MILRSKTLIHKKKSVSFNKQLDIFYYYLSKKEKIDKITIFNKIFYNFKYYF